MKKIVFEIFDPALCCSTGVRCPNPDEKLWTGFIPAYFNVIFKE